MFNCCEVVSKGDRVGDPRIATQVPNSAYAKQASPRGGVGNAGELLPAAVVALAEPAAVAASSSSALSLGLSHSPAASLAARGSNYGKSASPLAFPVPFRAFASALPNVETVSVNVFSADGQKYQIKGRVGTSVLDSIFENPEVGRKICNEELKTLFDAPAGTWGVKSKECRVTVQPTFLDKFPPRSKEEEDLLLTTYEELVETDELLDNARLASQLTLSKETDGVTVAVEVMRPLNLL